MFSNARVHVINSVINNKNAHLSVAIFTFNECEKVKQAGTSNDNYEECLLPETISLFYIEKYMNYRHRSYHQQLFEKLIEKNFNLSLTHARTHERIQSFQKILDRLRGAKVRHAYGDSSFFTQRLRVLKM